MNTGVLSCSVWLFYQPLLSTWRLKLWSLVTKWPRYSAVGTSLCHVLSPCVEFQELRTWLVVPVLVQSRWCRTKVSTWTWRITWQVCWSWPVNWWVCLFFLIFIWLSHKRNFLKKKLSRFNLNRFPSSPGWRWTAWQREITTVPSASPTSSTSWTRDSACSTWRTTLCASATTASSTTWRRSRRWSTTCPSAGWPRRRSLARKSSPPPKAALIGCGRRSRG